MNKINLLPWREQLRLQQHKIVFTILVGVVLSAVIILFALSKMLNNRIIIHEKNNLLLSQQIRNIENKIQQDKLILQQKQQLLQVFAIVSQFKKQQRRLLEIINTLPTVMPKNLYLTGIKINNNEIILNGKASIRAEITLLMQQLEKIVDLNKIMLNKINSSADNYDNDFQINIVRD